MNWKEKYKNKIVSAKEAASKIKSNDSVVFANACAAPRAIVEAMVANKDSYENVQITHMIPMSNISYVARGLERNFRHKSLFVGTATREAVNESRGDYIPVFFSKIPELFQKGYVPVDVAVVQVSPPDDHGYCSLGVCVDYGKSAVECAKMVIVEVNEYMPRTLGDSFVHVSKIDYMIDSSIPIIELKPPVIGEVERAIGENCAKLVEDGSTLQLGIGAIPDAVLLFLKDKKNLGIHSEMISDGVVELVEAGVITGSQKTLHPNKIVITFLMGTRRLYDFVDNNPLVQMYPVDYVNDPKVIAQNYKMVCINSCIAVDLMGQVAADTIGYKQFSAVGGQVDFVRGAAMAKDGKSIIAMPSTAKKGKASRILPLLEEGSAVTTSRNDVDYIVTEYGIAKLKGKTLRERGRALINIAHPNFRQDLINEWENRFKEQF